MTMGLKSLFSSSSPDTTEQLTDIKSEADRYKAQGLPDPQIQQLMQTVNSKGNIPATALYSMLQEIQKNAPPVPPPMPGNIATKAAKLVMMNNIQKQRGDLNVQQIQQMLNQPPPQPQQMPPGMAPQGAPMQGAPVQGPPPQGVPGMREGGLAGIPIHNVGKHYATGGIVAFDEGGNIQNEIAADDYFNRLEMPMQPQPMTLQQRMATGGVVALAKGGTFMDVDANDPFNAARLFGSSANMDNPFSPEPHYDTPPKSSDQKPSSDFNDDTDDGTDYVPKSPSHSAYSNYLTDILERHRGRTPPTGDEALENYRKFYNQQHIGDIFSGMDALNADRRARTQQFYEQTMGPMSDRAGSAAMLEAGSARGGTPGYVGPGLSGILGAYAQGMKAKLAAQQQAAHDYMTGRNLSDQASQDAALRQVALLDQGYGRAALLGREDIRDYYGTERGLGEALARGEESKALYGLRQDDRKYAHLDRLAAIDVARNRADTANAAELDRRLSANPDLRDAVTWLSKHSAPQTPDEQKRYDYYQRLVAASGYNPEDYLRRSYGAPSGVSVTPVSP